MEMYTHPADTTLFLVKATTFPEGIDEAFQTVETFYGSDRSFFGISYMDEHGTIIYKAGVEAREGEQPAEGVEVLIWPRGTYQTETIRDWQTNIPAIGQTFKQMCTHPQVDFQFPCIEWYTDDTEMICLTKLKTSTP